MEKYTSDELNSPLTNELLMRENWKELSKEIISELGLGVDNGTVLYGFNHYLLSVTNGVGRIIAVLREPKTMFCVIRGTYPNMAILIYKMYQLELKK